MKTPFFYKPKEVVVLGEEHYVDVYGQPPRGKGVWMFVDNADSELLCVIEGAYRTAKLQARQMAGDNGISRIRLLP